MPGTLLGGARKVLPPILLSDPVSQETFIFLRVFNGFREMGTQDPKIGALRAPNLHFLRVFNGFAKLSFS